MMTQDNYHFWTTHTDMSISIGNRLSGRIALITGASRGIGRAVAKHYAREGAKVILVATTVGALEEVDDEIHQETGQHATLVPLNLTDFNGIDNLGASIFERHGKLDILVGNAGTLGVLTPLGHMKPDAWQKVIDLNLTANWRLVRSMDPLLRQSDAGRAIFVTSTVGSMPRAYWGAYAISKAGLEMMAKIYAEEVEQTPVRSNLINPGATRTAMRAAAMPGEDPETVKPPDAVSEIFVRMGTASWIDNGVLVNSSGEIVG
jgi:NAD(P)-dependent dehydrogenase (short-subunit alcohol dehydrogenase family)